MTECDDFDLELSRFWNDLTEHGDRTSKHPDPETMELLRRLQRIANAPLPESARERVWNGLMESNEFPVSIKESSMFSTTDVLRTAPNGLAGPLHLVPASVKPQQIGRRRTFAIAAALIIALIGSIAGRPISDRFSSGGTNPEHAVIAPNVATPEAAATDETLFEITLPADVIPTGVPGTMALGWETIPANSVTGQPADECCPGAKVYFIVAGSVAVKGDGPIQVIRHDGANAIENHAAGESTDLGPGDLAVLRSEDAQTWTTGADEVNVVIQTVVSGDYPGPYSSLDWQTITYSYDVRSIEMPGGPYTLSLHQVRVAADTTFDVPDNVVHQLAILKDGKATVGQGSEGGFRAIGVTEPATIFILTLSTTSEGMGTPVAGMGDAEATPTP